VNFKLGRFTCDKAEDTLDGGHRCVHVEVHMVTSAISSAQPDGNFDSRSDTFCEILRSFSSFRGRVLGTHIASMEDPVGEFLGIRWEVLGVFWFSRHTPGIGYDLLIY